MSTTHEPTHHPNGAGTVNWDSLRTKALIVGGVGLALWLGLGLGLYDIRSLFSAYLVAFLFCISFTLGSMGLLFVQYLAGGRWGVILRRILEASTRTLPLMAIAFIPIAAHLLIHHDENDSIYWWTHEHHAEGPLESLTPEEQHTQYRIKNYLFPEWTIGRTVLYFLIWGGFIYALNRGALASERGENAQAIRERMKAVAGVGAVVFALTNTFAATDWAMSLEKSWASTMFPVIYTVTQFLNAWALAIVVSLWLKSRGALGHYHTHQDQLNQGSFLLAFTMFWSYTSFSQFMLIWVGNLPEEIPFFLKRTRDGWEWPARLLCVFHFAVPFVLLLYRDVKNNRTRLSAVAIGLIIMCLIDCIWWVEPVLSGFTERPLFLLIDAAAVAGLGGIWAWYFLGQLKSRSLLPHNELELLGHGH